MKPLAPLAALLAVALSVPAIAQDRFGPLIGPDALQAALDGSNAPLVLDIRTGEVDGTIPGAVAAPYGRFRGPSENPGQLLTPAALTEVLQSLGVSADRPTVVAHQGANETDFGAAARVYWTLKSSGVSELAILNGGVGGWQAAGLPMAEAPATPEPSDIVVTAYDPRWLATEDDVLAVVEGEAEATLIDARTPEQYEGDAAHGAAARPGTIPGARNLVHSTWFTGSTTEIDATAAPNLAAAAGLSGDDHLVSFCNTGHWAATNWFAMSELAGIEDVKLYPESMVGWSQAGQPMENTPGLLENLMNQIRN
jgi:thiosulfate/3-mercaptopyruvate sulfurtransferase